MPSSALNTLDRGAGLWRVTWKTDLWLYYLASAPFALALLWITQQALRFRISIALPALILALAYAVRIVGVGSYTRRLWTALGGECHKQQPWLTRAAAEVWSQGVLTALWLLGLVIIIGTGLFYSAAQLAPLYSGDPELRPLRRALSAARANYARQWLLLAMALLFGAIVWASFAALAMLLPLALSGLPGTSGVLGAEGLVGLLGTSPVFWLAVTLATYLALDPWFKCATLVAHFDRQSQTSGADLVAQLAALRAPKVATAAALAAPLAVADPRLASAIHAELQRPVYDWHGAGSATPSAFSRFLDRLLHPAAIALRWAGHELEKFWRWIFGAPAGNALPTAGGRGHLWETVVWIVAAACSIAIAVLWLRRRASPPTPAAPMELPPPDLSTASAAEQPSDAWFTLAESLLASGQCRLAMRAAFLGGLAGLARQRLITLRRDRTNREYLAEFRRSARLTPNPPPETDVAGGMREFDRVWYGAEHMSDPPDAARAARFLALQRQVAQP